MAEATIVLQGGATEDKISEIQYFFDVATEQSVEAGCDITDQYVENNSAIQEHVALKPIQVNLTGFVGEKVFRNESYLENKLDDYPTLKNALYIIPPVSSYVETVIGVSSYIESSINRYKSIKDRAKSILNKDNTETITRQSKVWSDLLALRDTRKLVTVYIENLGRFENYLIENVRMTQEDSVYQSRLIVDLKQYNSVSTQTVALNVKKYKDRVATQRSLEQNLGKVQGTNENTSTLYRWTYGRG